MEFGPQTHFGAKSQSEFIIALVPKLRKMVIIIPRRRRGTWEGVPVATWCSEWICKIWGGLGPHTLLFPVSLSLPLMRGTAIGRAATILQMTLFTPESPILKNLQFCWPLVWLCLVLFCTFVYVRMYVSVCSLWSGLCPFSELLCDLLPRQLFHGSPRAHCQESILVTILTSTAWRTLCLFGAFPTLVGRHHWSLGATFLGRRRDWLSQRRGFVSPRIHASPPNCDLF